MNNPPLVIVVDDEPAILELMQAQLAQENFELKCYTSGEELLADKASLELADILLLDIMMPGIDGFTLCQKIRQEQPRFLPIILVTALGETEHKVRGLDMGADDFVTKPSNAAELRARIRANLRAKQLHDELEEARLKIERLSHLKDLLTDMIVHDLRNPLGSLSLALQIMGDPPDASHIDPSTWALTRQQIDSALEMCQQLLDIRKLQSGELVVSHGPVHLPGLIDSAVAPLRLLAQERRIQLELDIADITCHADHKLLERVVMNLVHNAVKFSPNDQAVLISAQSLNGEISIAVTDKGSGIPAEHHEHIFELFATVKTNTEIRGYGIGLAFCQLVTQALGGRIALESEPNKGSRFTVYLPN